MSYIASLNLLGDDSPIPISEEALNEELALWANAQFTFDTKPGSALPDDSYKAIAEQQELFASLLNQQQKDEQLYTQLLTNQPPFYYPTAKLPIQPLSKEPRKRKTSVLSDQMSGEDDKRKRNTAASARFRMKKKLREQALEQTAKEMTLKAEAFEKRVLELEKEAKWLRALVVEKDPSLLSQ